GDAFLYLAGRGRTMRFCTPTRSASEGQAKTLAGASGWCAARVPLCGTGIAALLRAELSLRKRFNDAARHTPAMATVRLAPRRIRDGAGAAGLHRLRQPRRPRPPLAEPRPDATGGTRTRPSGVQRTLVQEP